MNSLANWITLIRIILIPWFTILLINGALNQALWVFLAAAVSDALDGFVARVFSQKTRLGSFLDPIADKLLLVHGLYHAGRFESDPGLADRDCHQPGCGDRHGRGRPFP